MSYRSGLKFSKLYILNLNMILDTEPPMVYLLSDWKIHLAS